MKLIFQKDACNHEIGRRDIKSEEFTFHGVPFCKKCDQYPSGERLFFIDDEQTKKIRNELENFDHCDKEWLAIKDKLKERADESYHQCYSDEEHLNFYRKYKPDFESDRQGQSDYAMSMFIVETQWIHADNEKQLVDLGIGLLKLQESNENRKD